MVARLRVTRFHVALLALSRSETQASHRLLGIDVVRDIASGKSWVLEVNAGGNVWHFSSPGWAERRRLFPEVPRLTEQQLAAMTMLETLANDPTFHVEMQFAPGDVQLLNNGRVLHAREAYTDHPHPDQRRHLLRLWLAARQFTSVEESLRSGIATS